jgi:hypothetical protein
MSNPPSSPAELWAIIQSLQQTVGTLHETLTQTRTTTEVAINDARTEIKALQDAATARDNELAQARSEADALRAATAVTSSSNPRPSASSNTRVKVNLPKEFLNDRTVAKDFLSQCEMVFEAQPEVYHSERLRVLFACSFLRGEAFKWYQTVGDNGNLTSRTTFAEFKALFETSWADTELKRNAADQIQTFKQTGKATAYASKFNYLSALTEFNDAALRTFFYNGLKEAIKDLLLSKPAATSLRVLQEQAIECDILVTRRDKERKKAQPAASLSSSPTTPIIPPAQPTNGPTPMDMSNINVGKPKGPLSPEEKLRRAQLKLCIYCGDGACAGAPNVELCPRLIKRNQGKGIRQA